ncbi:MAG: hypothetical protein CL942_08590 [Desulfovibrio sp.]|nr:hypothetical protein [Desulfovibrio sp.]|tara:strand:+ start:14611 stop:15816 length:1206 start_codon:yes stop_codon:yes gene_type:complete
MRFYTQTQLSEHIAETREGFLVCAAVPIARTGFMEYASHEVPLEPGKDGRVRVERTEKAVFDPDAMASFEGKPGTINHPAEDVTPANWKELAVGHAQNIRRGAGEASDLLLADMVITDKEAIKLIRGGLREVSCGYDADYEQVAPGHGRQSNIRGNHIALVHRGRCGSRCRINDESEDTMPEKKKSFRDKVKDFFADPEVKKVLDEEGGDPPAEKEKETPAADAPDDRIAALEAKVNELDIQVRNLSKPTEDEDDPEKEKPAADEEQPAEPDVPEEKKTADAAMARTVDADTTTRAKVLVPNMVVHDTDKLCSVQRAALRTASANDSNVSAVVASALNGSTLDSCDCVTLDAAFLAASEVAKAKNNQTTTDGLTQVSVKDFGKPVTPADINRLNSEFHKKG